MWKTTEQGEEGATATAMMAPSSAAVGPCEGTNGEYAREIAESLRFQEEIQSLMREGLLETTTMVVVPPPPVSVCVGGTVVPAPPPPATAASPVPAPSSSSSFTALLGLPPNQAMELLHDHTAPPPLRPPLLTVADFPFPNISPTFPTNAALVERAARFSVFAAANGEGSTESSSLHPSSNSAGYCEGANASSRAVKPEPDDSDCRSSDQMQQSQKLLETPSPPQPRGGKRKEAEKNKCKPGGSGTGTGGKKTKTGADDTTAAAGGGKSAADTEEDKQQLPYVHVRARRGQATDSHSLAERARREKINARMKLLQELVPGCSKISGTALVLDEIISHVQCLQRQVELLSMRLAAVNPRIDFAGLDSFFAAEPVRVPGSAVGMDAAAAAAAPTAALWAEVPVDGVFRRHHHQNSQIWNGDSAGPHPQQASPSMWTGDSVHHQQQLFMHHHHHHTQGIIGPGASIFGYDSTSEAPMHASQLKTEL